MAEILNESSGASLPPIIEMKKGSEEWNQLVAGKLDNLIDSIKKTGVPVSEPTKEPTPEKKQEKKREKEEDAKRIGEEVGKKISRHYEKIHKEAMANFDELRESTVSAIEGPFKLLIDPLTKFFKIDLDKVLKNTLDTTKKIAGNVAHNIGSLVGKIPGVKQFGDSLKSLFSPLTMGFKNILEGRNGVDLSKFQKHIDLRRTKKGTTFYTDESGKEYTQKEFSKLKATGGFESLFKGLGLSGLKKGSSNSSFMPSGSFGNSENIGAKIKGRSKFKETINPRESDLARTESGQSILFLFKNLFQGKKDKDGGMFGGLFKGGAGLLGTVGGVLLKALPFAAIIGGIIMMVIDGFTGFFKSKQWGASKLSSTVGGVLGGTSEGFKGAFANMGKWALIGAGVGTLIMPVIGTLIGGLLGAAVGGILGFIGGKKIAKAFDAIGKWFMQRIKDIQNFGMNLLQYMLPDVMKVFKDPKKSFGQKVIDGIGAYILDAVALPFKIVGTIISKLPFGKEIQDAVGNFFKPIIYWFEDIGKLFTKKGIIEGFKILINEKEFGKFRETEQTKRDQKAGINKKYDDQITKLGVSPKPADIEAINKKRNADLAKIEAMALGGLAMTPGYIKVAENEPEFIIPKSKVQRGFDNQIVKDAFSKSANVTDNKLAVLLEKINTTIDKKPFNNNTVVNKQDYFDLNKLRFVPNYGG